jgi:hypothetical protein
MEFLLRRKNVIKFTQTRISKALDLGRLMLGDLLFVESERRDGIDIPLLISSIADISYLVLVHKDCEACLLDSVPVVAVSCLHELVAALDKVVQDETKPAVLFIHCALTALATYRIPKLEEILLTLQAFKVAIVTDCKPVEHLATVKLLLNRL